MLKHSHVRECSLPPIHLRLISVLSTILVLTPHQVIPTHTHERREEANEGGEKYDGESYGPREEEGDTQEKEQDTDHDPPVTEGPGKP